MGWCVCVSDANEGIIHLRFKLQGRYKAQFTINVLCKLVVTRVVTRVVKT
jgi:hypothetical protein